MWFCRQTAPNRNASQFFNNLIKVLAVGIALAWAKPSWALFTIVYDGTATQVQIGSLSPSTFSDPSGLALDLSGNLYIADTGNNRIIKVTPGGTTSVFTITGLGTPLNSPNQMTVDGADNLYISDTGNNRVVKATPSGSGSVVGTQSITLSGPQGVALDALGDIFISDTGNNRVVEVTSGGTASVLATSSGVALTSLSSPMGIATDTYNNLYIVDNGNNRVVEVSTSLVGSTVGTYQSLNAPVAVTVGTNGVIYIVDGSNQVRVALHDPQGDEYDLFSDEINNEFGVPTAIAIDSQGTFYMTDAEGDQVNIFHQGSAAFGNVQLGSSGTPNTLNFIINGTTTVTGVAAYTAGTQNLDFTIAANSGTPCTTGSNGINCTVNIQFTPTAAGLRRGALVLSYNNDFLGSGNFTVPLYGYGDGPVAALAPGVASALSTGNAQLSSPFQTAYDGAGNIYVSDTLNNRILQIPAGGGSATVVNIPALPSPSGLSGPTGLAIDGAGDLFIADSGNNRIVEVTPAGASQIVNIIGAFSGFNNPQSLFIDGAGDLLVDDTGNNRIVQLTVAYAATDDNTLDITGAYVLATGSYSLGNNSSSAIFDTSQGLYISDNANNRVIKIDRLGNASLVNFSSLSQPLNTPHSIAFDPMGNLYVMDAGGASGSQRIIQQFTTGVNSTLSFSGASFGSAPNELAVDNGGNVLVADYAGSSATSRLVQVNVGQSALTFPSTKQGLSSPAQTVTVTDLGDQPLIFSANPGYTANFSENTSDENTCTSDTSLTVGISCDVSINFTPQSIGSLSANISVTNDTQNIAGSTQQIAVSGTGLNPGDITVATQTNPALGSYSYGQPITISAKIADTTNTGTIPTGTVSFTDALTSTTTQINLNTNGIATLLNNGVLSGIGTHNILAAYGGVSGTFLSSSTTISVAITKTSVTMTGPATQPVTVIDGQSGSAAITVTPAYTGGTMPSGTISYAIVNASDVTVGSGTATLTAGSSASIATVPIASTLASGTYTLTATYGGDTNYQSASASTITLVIAQNTPAIAWSTPTSITYGMNLSSLLTATASFGGSSVPGTFAYTVTPSGGSASTATSTTVLGAGTYTLTATFTPTNSNTYATATKSASLTVSKAALTITWSPAASSIAYGATLAGILDATASVGSTSIPGTFVYTATPSGGTAVAVNTSTVLGVGSYTLAMTFTPTDSKDYNSATGSVTLSVGATAPSVTLVTSSNPIILTSSVTFTASVASSVGTPTGSIGFYDGTTRLATVTLSNRQAVYTTSSLAVGTHSITAVYSGDSNFSAATSATVSELVQDFTISTPSSNTTNTPSATVTPGGTATYTLKIGPSVGTVFPAPVTLSLSGLPPGATGTLSPSTLPAGSSLSSVTLTIQLPQTARVDQKPNLMRTVPSIVLGLLLLMPFGRNWRRSGKRLRRNIATVLLLIGGAVTFVGLTGCASGNGFFAQATAQYTVTITATSGNLSHSTNVTLTVE